MNGMEIHGVKDTKNINNFLISKVAASFLRLNFLSDH